MSIGKVERRERRKRRIRKRCFGLPDKPRLTVYRSLRYVYAQLIDDLHSRTLTSSSSLDKKKGGGNRKAAEEVGMEIARRAQSLGLKVVCFDRNGFKYHGVVKAVADAARKEGLQF